MSLGALGVRTLRRSREDPPPEATLHRPTPLPLAEGPSLPVPRAWGRRPGRAALRREENPRWGSFQSPPLASNLSLDPTPFSLRLAGVGGRFTRGGGVVGPRRRELLEYPRPAVLRAGARGGSRGASSSGLRRRSLGASGEESTPRRPMSPGLGAGGVGSGGVALDGPPGVFGAGPASPPGGSCLRGFEPSVGSRGYSPPRHRGPLGGGARTSGVHRGVEAPGATRAPRIVRRRPGRVAPHTRTGEGGAGGRVGNGSSALTSASRP